MEEMQHGDTVPVTLEHPMTPLEQMEEDDMRRLHPILPSNAALDAAGDNGILLTDEQHRITHVTNGRIYNTIVKSELR